VELEEGLQNHFATEETFLFPMFRAVDPREAMTLQAEHQSLRETLLDLGGGVGVNLARSPQATRFAELLASHTRREEAMLYRWANTNLPPQTVEMVRSRLQRTFKALSAVVVM
jgi:hemerythrin-like domain-containing protein